MKYNSFNKKYKVKKPKKLNKIINSEKWIIVDIRPSEEWKTSHIKTSINIPHHIFKNLAYHKINRKKNILFISQTGHSHLDLYHWLKKYNFKVYILENGWNSVYLKDEYDPLVVFTPD